MTCKKCGGEMRLWLDAAWVQVVRVSELRVRGDRPRGQLKTERSGARAMIPALAFVTEGSDEK